MRRGNGRLVVRLVVCLAVSLACILLHGYLGHHSQTVGLDELGVKVQRSLNDQEEMMRADMLLAADSLRNATSAYDTLRILSQNGSKDNYSKYLFRRGELVYWHNAELPVTDLPTDYLLPPVVSAANGVYYVVSQELSPGTVMAVALKVRSYYPYRNEYLEESFAPTLGISDTGSDISLEKTPSGVPVYDSSGCYLFSVISTEGKTKPMAWALLVESALLLVWVVSSVLALLVAVKLVGQVAPAWLTMLVALLAFGGLYCVSLVIDLSETMAATFLFSKQVFAYDWWIPSLGHILMLSLCLMMVCYVFLLYYRHAGLESAIGVRAALFVSLGLQLAAFVVVNGIINIIVHHSSDLAIYVGDLDVSQTSLVKVVILSFSMMAFQMVLEKSYSGISLAVMPREFLLSLLVFSVAVVWPVCRLQNSYAWVIVLSFVAFATLFFVLKRKTTAIFNFSHFVWCMIAVSLFVLGKLMFLNHDKESANRQLLATNLSFQMLREDDPIAEQLLLDIEKGMESDTTLVEAMDTTIVDESKVFALVRDKYMGGYFSQHVLQVVICNEVNSTVTITSTGEQPDCQLYFDELIKDQGKSFKDSKHFYCLNNGNYRPDYLGVFSFGDNAHLYVQVDLKTNKQGVGYPELLTNQRDRMNMRQLKGYSYAKYNNGIIADSYGDFDYPASLPVKVGRESVDTESGGYSHHYVSPVENQVIVLSYPELTFSQCVTDYSYVFLCMFAVSLIVMALVSYQLNGFLSNMNISERIHLSFVSFVLLLFVVECVVSGTQSISRYEDESHKNMSNVLRNTCQRLSSEMMNAPFLADYREGDLAALDNILIRTADDYQSDIHLFSPEGHLVATSRRELFKSALVAPLINDEAWRQLLDGHAREVFVKEQIGSFDYYSIYAPLYVDDNRLAGYVNVPLFTDVNAIRQQLLSSLVPVSNSLMLIIFLAVIFSYFLANGITSPIISLGERLKSIDLGKDNVKLEYPYGDEIGQVVNAYNRMTDTLASQAGKLAANERESTWREMARKIAHEIKNPLTPMKLSVQYLLKTWEDRPEGFEKVLYRTSRTLIEQIDQLATVASQFSGIAKMKPGAIERVDIAQCVLGTVDLFANSENATVQYDGPESDVVVLANAAELKSVFNNLIKNALQSVPEDRHVDIHVTLNTDGNTVKVDVRDNGLGIPEDIRENIFRPNFTTKSTGNGLGLAITNTIVVNAGGTITFDTRMGEGTTFHVVLPLAPAD